MKKLSVFLISICILFEVNHGYSQTIYGFNTIFSYTYPENVGGCFTRLSIFDDTNLAIAGIYYQGGKDNELATLVDFDGNVIWQVHRDPGSDHGRFSGTLQYNNSNILFYGMQNGQGTDYFDPIYVVYNSIGTEISYTPLIIPGSSDQQKMVELSNGGYGVVGKYDNNSQYIATIDHDFSLVEMNSFPNPVGSERFATIVKDDIENLYIIGPAEAYTTPSEIRVSKYDLDLNLHWTQTYGGINSEYALDAVYKEGNITIVGFSNSFNAGAYSAYILQIDTSGILQWDTTLVSSSNYTVAERIYSLDTGYLITVDHYTTPWEPDSSRLYNIGENGEMFNSIILFNSQPFATRGIAVVNGTHIYISGYVENGIRNPALTKVELIPCSNFVVGSISANQSICYNTTPAQLTGVAPTGGNTPYTYQWQSSTDNVTFTDITGAVNLTYQPGALTATTYYRLNQTSASGCGTLTTNTVTITVYPDFVVGSISADQSICYNTTPAQLTSVAPTGGNTPYTYQWQSSSDNVTFTDITGATSLNYQPGALTATTYYRLNQTSASGCGTLTTNTVTITVYPDFVIGSISADQSICYNTTPAQLIGVAPTGGNTPYTYQWQSSTDNITFADITGATNLNYQPGALTVTTYYRLNQTSASGCGTLTTNTVTITVYPNFVVGSISADQSICYNTTPAQLTGIAPTDGNTPYTYQWQSSTDNITFADITGATNLNYQPGALTVTTYYRLNQTSASNCGTLTTNTVTITVYPDFVVGSISSDQTICYNTTPAQLTGVAPTGGNTPYTYQWQSSSDNVTFTDITGETSLNYQPGALTATTYYRQNQTSASGCGTLTTNTVTITVYPDFVVGSISADQTICYNTIPALLTGVAPTGGNTPYTYQWQSSTDNITFADITGATSLNYQPGALTATTYYWLNQTSASGCGTLTTNTVTITVYPDFVVGSISANQSICYNTTPAQLTGVAPTGGNTPYTYQWQSSTDNVTFTDITGAVNLTYQPGALTATTYYRLNQTSASGCGTLTTNTVTITVYPDFVVGSISADQSICYNTTPDQLTGVAPTGGNKPYTYQWQSSTDNITFSDITGATSLNYQPGALTATTYYRLNQTSASGCGTLTTNTVTITVYGNFVVGSISADQSICYNTTPAQLTGVAPTGGNTPYTYQWQSSSDNVTFTDITGATSLNYQPGALTATTYFRLNQTSASGCGTLSTNTVTITVYPDFVVGSISTDQSICYNTTPAQLTGVAPTGGNTPYTYQWQSSTDNITFADIAGATNLNYQPGALTVTTYYRLNQSSASGCGTVSTNTVTIIVNPLPVPTITGPAGVCAQSTGNVYTTESGMTSYIWAVSAGGTITAGGSSTSNTVTVTWNTAGAQYVTISYTNTLGCTAAAPVSYDVTVSPIPTPTITGSTTLCVNSGSYFYSTEAGMTNYTWTVSAGGTIIWGAGTNQIEISWNIAGAQTVTVNYTNPNGCSAPTPTSLAVTVNPLPGAAGNITGTSEVCGGTQGVAYSVAPIANTVYYVWTLPPGATIASGAGTNSITVDFDPFALSGNITVYGNNLCGNGSLSPPFPVTVNPLPDPAGTIMGEESVCLGDQGVTYTVPAIANATGYTWTVPAGATIASGANTNTITVDFSASATSGMITVLGTNTCGNGEISPDFSVTVNPIPPTPTITESGTTLTSSAASGNQWHLNGMVIPGATGQAYEVTESGEYYVIVTLNGCSSDPSNIILIVMPGINQLSGSTLNVYPVPNDGKFTVASNWIIDETLILEVYNYLGVRIHESRVQPIQGKVEQIVYLRQVPNGVYTVILRTEDQRVIRRILVNK